MLGGGCNKLVSEQKFRFSESGNRGRLPFSLTIDYGIRQLEVLFASGILGSRGFQSAPC